jgi:hypothetical protein
MDGQLVQLFFVLSEIINYYFVLDIGFRGLDSYYCLTSTVIFLDEPSLSTLFKRYIYIYISRFCYQGRLATYVT